ncbi:MAG: thioredoxin domain-containing protein [Pseudomonadota bacterium]
MKLTKRLIALAFAAPFALTLSSCGDSADPEGGLSGDPIDPIAAPEGQAWTDVVNITEQGGYQLGNPDAPIKLVEYASHTCPACASFSVTAKGPLRDDYISTGVVAFEHRQLIRSALDLTIATMVQCGPKETMQPLSDQAWASLNEIFANVEANSAQIEAAGEMPMNERFVAIAQGMGLIDFFAARGLSADQARTCLADVETIEGIAEQSAQQVDADNVTGTPTFLLNGARVEGIGWEQIEPALQRAGARTE